MLPLNFVPKRGKKTFNFLTNHVWKEVKDFPFEHYCCTHYNGVGLFSTLTNPKLEVGDQFEFLKEKYVVETIDNAEFPFNREFTEYTVYFNKI